jgi:hypothetical protein
MRGRLPWAAIVVLAVAWLCIDGVLIAPDFGHTDIYYFKDSGVNFAEGLGLKTRFTYGNPTFAYRDYAQYPPLYPLLFGVYAKAAGISAASNQLFNSLVAMLVGLLGFLALQPIIAAAFGVRARMAAGALAVASIATGYTGFDYDRPDGLAVALGIGAVLSAICGATWGSAAAAGVLCALAAFTSPFAGIWTCWAVFCGVLAGSAGSSPGTSPGTLRTRLFRLLFVAAGGAATALFALALLWLSLPGWFDGFFGVATGANTHNETGGGYFLALLKGDFRTWRSGFSYAAPELLASLLKLCAVAAALLWTILASRRLPSGNRQNLRLLPLALASPLCLVTAPYQSNYCLITAALLLAVWAGIESVKPTVGSRMPAMAILAAFAANVVLTVPFEARALAVRCNTRESLARALEFVEAHRSDLEIPGSYIAVSPSNYILWRQAGLHPLVNIYSGFADPANRAHLQVLALSYPGSGNPQRPQNAEFVPLEEYRPVFEPELPQFATLFGHALSKSSQTWESAIYSRCARPGCPSPYRENVGIDEKREPGNLHDQ